MLFYRSIMSVALILLSSLANAAPVTWYVEATDFQTNSPISGSIKGSFIYDVDLNQFSSVDFVAIDFTSAGTNGNYTFAQSGFNNSSTLTSNQNVLTIGKTEPDALGLFESVFSFKFDTPLSNAGGTFNFGPFDIELNDCTTGSGLDCTFQTFVDSHTGTYTTFASAVPEPETYAMLLAGLALLGGAKRRKFV